MYVRICEDDVHIISGLKPNKISRFLSSLTCKAPAIVFGFKASRQYVHCEVMSVCIRI